MKWVPSLMFGVVAVAVCLSTSGEISAQATREPVPHTQVLSANPFALLFEWFNADYERVIGQSTSFGAQGSLVTLDGGDEDFFSLTAFLRYYPQNAVLSGFYVGPRFGVYRVDDVGDDEAALGFGFETGYAWLLGRDRNFHISLGLGATRLFGLDLDASATVPTVRLINLGWAW